MGESRCLVFDISSLFPTFLLRLIFPPKTTPSLIDPTAYFLFISVFVTDVLPKIYLIINLIYFFPNFDIFWYLNILGFLMLIFNPVSAPFSVNSTLISFNFIVPFSVMITSAANLKLPSHSPAIFILLFSLISPLKTSFRMQLNK